MDIENELKRELKYRPEIEQILDNNLHLIIDDGIKVLSLNKATTDQDTEEATDFIYYSNLKIPVRIRKPRYYGYMGQFTIRWRSYGGNRTEIDKLSDGHGDVYFYAWTKQDADKVEFIEDWILINLHKLRGRHNLSRENELLKLNAKSNGDKATAFTFYDIRDISDCIINGSKKAMKKANKIKRINRIPTGSQGTINFIGH